MGAFMVIVLKLNADSVWELFEPYHSQFIPFRDASYGDSTYECTVSNSLFSLIHIRFSIV
jgi:cell division cycle 14